MKVKYCPSTQKQNNKAWNLYKTQLANWRNEHANNTLNVNGVSAGEIQQRLTLGREPNAKLVIDSTNGKIDNNFLYVHGWDGSDGDNPTVQQMMQRLKIDSQSFQIIKFKPNQKGSVSVDYDNLSHSSYIDNNGKTRHISKIEVNYDVDAASVDHGIILFSDPTDGFGYLATTGVNATYTLYGDDGKPLDLSAGHAYITITSLNHHYDGDATSGVESVQGRNNTKVYAILGSSISNHNGTLYADKNNDESGKHDSTWKNKDPWDQKGPNEYYGAGLIEATNNGFQLRYFVQNPGLDMAKLWMGNKHGQNNGTGNGPWVTITTDILATPGPETPKVPQKASVHYHYDVFIFSVKARTFLIFHYNLTILYTIFSSLYLNFMASSQWN